MDNMSNPDQFKGKGALDAFLNLFSLITLGWMAIAIGMMLFQIIDKFLSPGTVSTLSSYSQSGLKFGVASALIVTPIFLLIVSSLHKKYKAGALSPQSGVYRWLTYLILLIAGLNIIGRLIQLVFQLLDGDYTLASILKIVVVLLIASGIFGYYWYDLKRTDYSKKSSISMAFFALIVVVALGGIITSFFVIDSPAVTQAKKQDLQRAEDLSGIDNMINNYYIENEELPADLSATRFNQFSDPKTGESYGYNVTGTQEYELCATFDLIADPNDEYRYYDGKDWYYHKEGYQCFKSSITSDLKPSPVIIR